METDGEGGGGEVERRGRSELGRLLEAIGSSEVRHLIPHSTPQIPFLRSISISPLLRTS
jgi:hypothetical protein